VPARVRAPMFVVLGTLYRRRHFQILPTTP
jgi:hypothetical protein